MFVVKIKKNCFIYVKYINVFFIKGGKLHLHIGCFSNEEQFSF